MTPATILALPVGEVLRALYKAGLMPAGIPGQVSELWQPHLSWNDCMPLVERFRLRLVPYHRAGLTSWGVYCQAYGESVERFAEVPALICRMALIIHTSAHLA